MKRWAIYLTATGELVQTACCDTHPRFHGYAWESGVHSATEIGDPDDAVQTWNPIAKAYQPDMTKVRARLLAKVDAEAEAARRLIMTQGAGQSYVYAEKAGEVHDYRNVIGALLGTLSTVARTNRFPFAMAEAAATGDSLATVIARFEAGIAASKMKIAEIDGRRTKAKAAIRAAQTTQAATSAATVTWPA